MLRAVCCVLRVLGAERRPPLCSGGVPPRCLPAGSRRSPARSPACLRGCSGLRERPQPGLLAQPRAETPALTGGPFCAVLQAPWFPRGHWRLRRALLLTLCPLREAEALSEVCWPPVLLRSGSPRGADKEAEGPLAWNLPLVCLPLSPPHPKPTGQVWFPRPRHMQSLDKNYREPDRRE